MRRLKKHAEDSYYTPSSPEDAARWYKEQRAKNRTIYWDGVSKRMLSTTEADVRKLKVDDPSKLAQVYSESDIIRLLTSIWEPTPSAMGSVVDRVITYKGQLYTLHEITASSPVWYKARLMKALRKVGKRAIKGVTFKIIKDGPLHSHAPGVILISERDLTHRGTDCEALKKRLPPHAPYQCGDNICPFGLSKLGKLDFGLDHAAHVIALKLGHNFWHHRMSSGLREMFLERILRLPVKSKDIKDHQRYTLERLQDQEDENKSAVSKALKNTQAAHKFMEMYRLYVMYGKYSKLMASITAAMKASGPVADHDTTTHSERAQQLPSPERTVSPYLGDRP